MGSKVVQLKDLIKKSQSIDEEEKTSIINQLQDLNEEDINKMIKIFTWEQEQIKVLNDQRKEAINDLKEYANKSIKKIKKLKKDIVIKAEKRISEQEHKKAENLLNFDK